MNLAATLTSDKAKPWLTALACVSVLAMLGGLAALAYEDEAAWRDMLEAFLTKARGTPWALPLVCVTYVLGSLVLFPVILLNLVCAIVFGLWGIVYALVGAMLNVSVYFGIGYYIRQHKGGKEWLKQPMLAKVDKMLRKSGIAGPMLVHMLPAPPFFVTNIIGGLSSITFATFFTGTLLSLLPGAIARGIVGDSLTKILLNPTPETYLYLGLGIALWVSVVAGMHIILKKLHKE